MTFPKGFLFEYPGFPSITVSYLKTNDFFYSGHVGMPVILMCEFYFLKRYYMFSFSIFTFFVEFFTMIFLRSHYSIDLISGAIFAHYIFQNVSKITHYFDNLTFNKLENRKNIENFENESHNDNLAKTQNTEFLPVPIKNNV